MTRTRFRKYFITINKGAKCFDSFVDSLGMCEKYAYIFHDKDNEEQPHYHLVISYKNQKSFETVRKEFEGSHIEKCESWTSCLRYLTHKDNTEKYQYEDSDIVSNFVLENEDIDNPYISVDAREFISFVKSGKIKSLTDCLYIYGMHNTNQYKTLMKDMIDVILSEEEDRKYLEAKERKEKEQKANRDLLFEDLSDVIVYEK